MPVYMFAYISQYILGFCIVGVTFVAVDALIKGLFDRWLGSYSRYAKETFFYFYFGMISFTILVMIAQPIDRAICKIRFFSTVSAIVMNITFLSVSYLLVTQGWRTPVRTCVQDPDNPNSDECVMVANLDGETYFSWIRLAGVVSLIFYVLPFFMRPLDFLFNFKKYCVGFLCYMLLLPVFTFMFQIYAICNLHDVSWGNRPTSNSA